MFDRKSLTEVQAALSCGVLFWGIGRALHYFRARENKSKHVHGRFIPEWTGAGYVVFGLLALFWFGPAPGVTVPHSLTLAGFGLSVLRAVGWIHGSLQLRQHRLRNDDSKFPQSNRTPDDRNPCRPA
ncbi:MAG: hypothetical protein AAFN70_12345 [Planctomycetota bacterium]